VQPREPEPAEAVAKEVEQRLQVVIGVHVVDVVELAVAREHRVSLEGALGLGVRGVNPVSIAEVNEVVEPVLPEDIVQFQILMDEPCYMQLFQGTEHLHTHVDYLLFELKALCQTLRLHVGDPILV